MHRMTKTPLPPPAAASHSIPGPSQPALGQDFQEPIRSQECRLWLSSARLSFAEIGEEEPADPQEQELLNGY
jgi:hypothetical protein